METSAKTATNVNDIFYEIGMTFYCVVLEFISQITQKVEIEIWIDFIKLVIWGLHMHRTIIIIIIIFWCLLVVPNGVGLLTITDVFLMTKL